MCASCFICYACCHCILFTSTFPPQPHNLFSNTFYMRLSCSLVFSLTDYLAIYTVIILDYIRFWLIPQLDIKRSVGFQDTQESQGKCMLVHKHKAPPLQNLDAERSEVKGNFDLPYNRCWRSSSTQNKYISTCMFWSCPIHLRLSISTDSPVFIYFNPQK